MHDKLFIEGGKIAYNLIKDSENAIKLGTLPSANAIPIGASVEQMNGWKKASVHLTKKIGGKFITSNLGDLLGKNGDLLDVDIYLTWLYGGKFNGKGQYIANATSYCIINKCDGTISFNLTTSFGSPFNDAESENDAKAHLPFTVTIHIIQRLFLFKALEHILVCRGEIGGEEGIYENNTIGWFSYNWEQTL
jgi:hypothetical protein